MNVLAYKVETSDDSHLGNLFTRVSSLSLDDRICQTATTRMRLEEAIRDRRGLWLLDFVKFRTFGPGKVSDSLPTEDFELEDDEYFGEETAGVYDETNNILALQYNHYGPRYAALEAYLTIMAVTFFGTRQGTFNNVQLLPCVTRAATQKLQQFRTIRRLDYRIFVPGIRTAPGAVQQSVGAILSDRVIASAETLSVSVKAGRSGSLSVAQVRSQIGNLLRARQDVSKLRVGGSLESDGPTEFVNMLEAQLSANVRVPLMSKGRRFLRAERWQTIREEYSKWVDGGEF